MTVSNVHFWIFYYFFSLFVCVRQEQMKRKGGNSLASSYVTVGRYRKQLPGIICYFGIWSQGRKLITKRIQR